MKTTRPILLLAITLGLLPALIPAAHASDVTFPKDSTPSLAVHCPEGWSSTPTGTTLIVKNADATGVVTMVLVGDAADAVKMPYDQFARQVFDSAGIKTIDKKEEFTFAGIKGMAYYGSLTNATGIAVNMKVIIVHIDATHIGAVTRATAQNLDADQVAAADKIIATTKLNPAK